MSGSRRVVVDALADFFSEAGVLVAVFVPLEAAVNQTLTGGTVVFTVVVVVVFLGVGTWLRIKASSSIS